MSDNPPSPLLESSEPSTQASARPSSARSSQSIQTHESTPLLSQSQDDARYDGENRNTSSPASSSLRSLQNGGSSKSSKASRWPTAIAITILTLLLVVIMTVGFIGPSVVEEYAKEAMVVEPTNLSIDSFTKTGVKARIQADFRLDASKVKKASVRNIGRFSTWIARKVESKASRLNVYLPDYDNMLLGVAVVPPIVVGIRNGHTNHIDFLSDLEAGDLKGTRNIANDWFEGRLDQLKVQGKADVALKSGIFSLGSQTLSESFVFKGHDIPTMPKYNITQMHFNELQLPSGRTGMAANVSISVSNSYPVELTIPPLGFEILVRNCADTDPYIALADATTDTINIKPNTDVDVEVGGIVRKLPKTLTRACPNSDASPLDILLRDYVHGQDTTVFVRGSNSPDSSTPKWVSELTSSVTVPVPFPGHTFDHAIKNFSLANVHFGLPDPLAEPGSPQSQPTVTGTIMVLANIPEQMNFGLNVTRVRSKADVFYKGDKLGYLNLRKWQSANSTRIEGSDDEKPTLKIMSDIVKAPLEVTDDNVFTDVIQQLLFGGKNVLLKVKASVDTEVETVLGKFTVKDLPAEGIVPIKAPMTGGDGGFNTLRPQIGDLNIITTGPTSLTLQAKVNITNPTEYTAHVPYFSINILNNGSVIGQATARDVDVKKGNNSNILVHAIWDPSTLGGEAGAKIGRDLLSQYICGWNTTLTLKTYNGTIPSQPGLGDALSKFELVMPTPKLGTGQGDGGDDDGDDDDDDTDDHPHFIKSATFHLFTSTAVFSLLSPLQHSSLYIDSINATAFYNHTEPVGRIDYDLPFRVPPAVVYETPRLPVDWSLGSVGYGAVRKALGGELKLDAKANVTIRLGQWKEDIWFVGGGIGASVRL